MLLNILIFPLKAAALVAFLYAAAGWLILPPSLIVGGFPNV